MAYIGRDTDKLSNIEVLDTITFDGSSSYTLQKNSVNFTPSSANNVLVSIDGVVQANNFTVSGSTIDFGVAVPSTSTCDWIYHIGVGLITTPADGTVSSAQLGTGAITGQTALAESPASDDQFLIYDTSATSFKKLAASYVGGSNTPCFYAYLSTTQTGLTDATVVKMPINTEVLDTDSCYDNATNYRFTPTTAGKYFLSGAVGFESDVISNLRACDLKIYKNGSSIANHSFNLTENMGRSLTPTINIIVDANGTSDYFELYGQLDTNNSGNWKAAGYSSTSEIRTFFSGYRLIGV